MSNMWIDLTDNAGAQLRINLDNVTHMEAGGTTAAITQGRGYAVVHLINAQTLMVKEDLSEVVRKMEEPVA